MARAFAAKGHQVIVMTDTPGKAEPIYEETFKVIRRPRMQDLLKLLKGCDVYWQNAISLRHLYANFFCRKPCVISFTGEIGQNAFIKKLKYFFLSRNKVVSVSRGIATLIEGIPHEVIHNAFEPEDFYFAIPTEQRKKHLVFVGRLIREKGVDTVLHSIARIKMRFGKKINFTVIGSGYEKAALIQLAQKLDLAEEVEFVGAKNGHELTELINKHQIMVVPSNCPEAFGIVALEGIACGCPVIASDNFGLPEAIGPVGVLFSRGDIEDCTGKIVTLADNFALQKQLLKNRDKHLVEHSADYIAEKYLKIFHQAMKQRHHF